MSHPRFAPCYAASGTLAVRAWRKGQAPRAIALTALKGVALFTGLALVLIVAFWRY